MFIGTAYRNRPRPFAQRSKKRILGSASSSLSSSSSSLLLLLLLFSDDDPCSLPSRFLSRCAKERTLIALDFRRINAPLDALRRILCGGCDGEEGEDSGEDARTGVKPPANLVAISAIVSARSAEERKDGIVQLYD